MEIKEYAFKGLHEKVWLRFKQIASKNDSILVLGSGEGAFEKRLLKEGFTKITSVDYYTTPKVHGKYLSLDLNNPMFCRRIKKKYDIIIAIEIVEHLNDTHSFFKNVKELLKKSSILLLSTPNVHSRLSRIDFLLTGYPTFFITNPTTGGHIHPIFKKIIEYHLKDVGLTIEERIPIGNQLTYFKIYNKVSVKSFIYLLTIILMNILLWPFMLINRDLKKGVNSLYIIKHKEQQ